jgi:hypothetical protein
LGNCDAVIVCCAGDRPTAEDGSRVTSICMRGVPDEGVVRADQSRRRLYEGARIDDSIL